LSRLEECQYALEGCLRVARMQQAKFMSCVPRRHDDQKIAFLALHNRKRPNGTPRVGCRRSPGPETRLLIQLLHVNLLQICCSCSKMKYLMQVLVAGCGTGCDSFLRRLSAAC